MSATEELRALLDERGVRHTDFCNVTTWKDSRGRKVNGYEHNGEISLRLTPEQAIAATLGRPTWRDSYDQERFDRWYDSLHHNGKPTNFAELVEEIIWMCETIDLGPNGNTCQGVDEGEVQTDRLINHWAEIAATLGGGRLTAEQVREAIERHAIPLLGRMWQFIDRSYEAIADELNAALDSGECELVETDSYSSACETVHVLECSACGQTCEHVNGAYNYCPNCGAKVRKAVEQ